MSISNKKKVHIISYSKHGELQVAVEIHGPLGWKNPDKSIAIGRLNGAILSRKEAIELALDIIKVAHQ